MHSNTATTEIPLSSKGESLQMVDHRTGSSPRKVKVFFYVLKDKNGYFVI